MSDFEIRPYRDSDQEDVVALWHETGLYHPDNNPYDEIKRKMKDSPNFFLVAVSEHHIIGTIMIGYEGHRGWINYLGVKPSHQHKNVGRNLLHTAEELLQNMGCIKINLQIRQTNRSVIYFYKSLGYSIENVISMGKRIDFDNPQL